MIRELLILRLLQGSWRGGRVLGDVGRGGYVRSVGRMDTEIGAAY